MAGGWSCQVTSRRWGRVTAFVLALLGATVDGGAQELDIHGFVQANYSLRVAEPAPGDPVDDFLLGDHRVQLELGSSSDSGTVRFGSKVDLVHDAVSGEAMLDLRETHITFGRDRYDVTVGRQVLTWGVGDLLFINDVFTKDWTALIAGQPLQYLKVGSDALNTNLYLGPVSVQIVAVPFFEPDVLPRGDRIVGYTPFPGLPVVAELPDRTLRNTELAARLSGYVGGFDVAAYAYRGFWGAPPGIRPDIGRVTWYYPHLSVYGGSLQGAFGSGILSGEVGFYDSRNDAGGRNPAIENSQVRLLVGYQRAFGSDLTVGGQYSAERMLDHDAYRATLPSGFPERPGTRHNLTARVTRTFNYQSSHVSVFFWGSPNERDFFLNPEVRHGVTDEAWVAVGANLFGGTEPHTFFGQFDRNDNLYATVRYSF